LLTAIATSLGIEFSSVKVLEAARFEIGDIASSDRKADAALPDRFSIDVRAGVIFCNAFKLICPVQSRFQK
jgi:hypothetical protein